MKKPFACVTYIFLIMVLACSTVSLTSAISRKEQNVKDITILTRINFPTKRPFKQKKYDAISVKDMLFFNGSKSIDVLSLTPSKLKEFLGKPNKIEKGYSEMEDDDTLTYIYPDGEIMFLVKQKFWYIEVKGPGWSFGIKDNSGKISKFSPGNSLALLGKLFPHSYKNPINTIYINLGIKTPSGILSDSSLSFEVNRLQNKIISISLD